MKLDLSQIGKKQIPHNPANLIDIPIELVNQFLTNPLNSLRDYASIPTDAIHPFFRNYDKLDKCLLDYNPFNPETRMFAEGFQCEDNHYRYMHIDLSIVGDGVGISMCHIPEFILKKYTINNEEKQTFEEIEIWMPRIVFDFTSRILNKDGKEFLIGMARNMVFELRDSRGFDINLITFDRFESSESIHTLREAGFNVAHLSLDRTSHKVIVDYEQENNVKRVSTEQQYMSAFEVIRTAIEEERMEVTPHPDWRQETQGLEEVNGKVIKSPHSSDDLIQSIAGAAYNAVNNEEYIDTEAKPDETIADKKYDEQLYSRPNLGLFESDGVYDQYKTGAI